MAKEVFTVTDEDGVVRVDKHLARLFPEYSRAALTKLFELKVIKLNGEPIQPGFRLRPGAVVEYDLGPLQAKPEVIDLPIVFENDDVIVIDKPAGIISHARGKFWQEASVASFIRDKVSQATQIGDRRSEIGETQSSDTQNSKLETKKSLRAGIVHRLDRATSGIMICAKHESAMKFLQKQFHDRTVKKTYVAVIEGALSPEKAKIVAPIERNLKEPKKFHISATGKSAETTYEVIDTSEKFSRVLLTPLTGRTHQLRLHLDYLGHPIVGDALYGGKAHDRLLLHANSLEIQLPDGKTQLFESQIPSEFNLTSVEQYYAR